jgi:hypothetical protein
MCVVTEIRLPFGNSTPGLIHQKRPNGYQSSEVAADKCIGLLRACAMKSGVY